MFSSLSTTALALSGFFAEEDGQVGIAPDGSEPIGWLAGGFTLILFIVVAFLIWSFVRTSRRAKAQWAEREGVENGAAARENSTKGETKPQP